MAIFTYLNIRDILNEITEKRIREKNYRTLMARSVERKSYPLTHIKSCPIYLLYLKCLYR